MCIQENIRRLDAEGVPGREIARRLGVSRDSVTKYASQGDFSPTPPPARKRPAGSVLAGFTGLIDQWLDDDQRRPRKQRHTATRVFDRLVAEHDYVGSYSPVQRHVKRWREAHRVGGDGFNELSWPAGTAQVDFGQAEAIIAGIRMVLHVLVVTFPFSNMRFAQAYRGETAECIAHGLRTVPGYGRRHQNRLPVLQHRCVQTLLLRLLTAHSQRGMFGSTPLTRQLTLPWRFRCAR